MTRVRWLALALALTFAIPAGARLASAQAFPDHAQRIVVPFPAGGGTDLTAREVARRMSEDLGQPVVVENRSGGNTAIAAEHVARSRPDGYTLLFGGAATFSVPPLLSDKLPYRVGDFAPVSLVVKLAYALLVHPSMPATLPEFVASLRAQPGAFSFAHAGTGGTTHLVGERFMAATGTRMVAVPYRGGQPALTDAVSGQVKVVFEAAPGAFGFHRAGTLRMLAVTSGERQPLAPDVPTFAELGYPDLTVYSWIGLFAPRDTPAPVIRRLNQAVAFALNDAGLRARIEGLGSKVEGSTPEELGALMAQDIREWRRVIEPLGLRLD